VIEQCREAAQHLVIGQILHARCHEVPGTATEWCPFGGELFGVTE
jgi:hypothetical protein